MPANLAQALLDVFRRDSIAPRRAAHAPLSAMPEDIGHVPVWTHKLVAGDWAIGRTLRETDLRAETGASVLAIRNGRGTFSPPPADLRLQADDVLYLVGDESDVLLARRRLTGGE